MCQCGCAEYPVEQVYRLTDRCILGVKVYSGCRECFPGLAVDLSVYNSAKVEWLEQALEMGADESIDECESVAEWLDQEGFELLQGAARKFAAKHAAQIAEIESRKGDR